MTGVGGAAPPASPRPALIAPHSCESCRDRSSAHLCAPEELLCPGCEGQGAREERGCGQAECQHQEPALGCDQPLGNMAQLEMKD